MIPVRLGDVDVYQHVNNVIYYSYFDTLVNDYMIRFGGLDMVNDPVIGLVVETACRFHQSIGFPERSEEHTSELQSLMRISNAVFCLKKKRDILITKRISTVWNCSKQLKQLIATEE